MKRSVRLCHRVGRRFRHVVNTVGMKCHPFLIWSYADCRPMSAPDSPRPELSCWTDTDIINPGESNEKR